jgi:hypothetical protein
METVASALEGMGWRRRVDAWLGKSFDGVGKIGIEILIYPMLINRGHGYGEFGFDVREQMDCDPEGRTYLMRSSFRGAGFFDVNDMRSPAMRGLLVFDSVVCARLKRAQTEIQQLQREDRPMGC